MANNEGVIGILRVLLSMNTAEFDKGVTSSLGGLSKMKGGLDKAVEGFEALGGEGSALSGVFTKLSGTIGSVVEGVGALGPAGAAAAVGVVAASAGVVALLAASTEAASVIADMTQKAADYGKELYDLSLKTGLSVSALSELKFVGEQTGVPLDAMTTSIFKLGQNLSGATDPASKVGKALHDLGLSLDEVRKLSPEKAFELILQRLHEIPDAGKRAYDGVALMGKGFKSVAGLAQEDIQPLIDKAHELGLVMSTEFAVAGDRFTKAMGAIHAQINALEVKIGAQFLPVAIAFAETFSKNLTEAFAAGAKGTAGFADTLAQWAVTVGQILAATIEVLAKAADAIVQFFAGTFIKNLGLLAFFGEATTAIGNFLQAAGTMNPVFAAAGNLAVAAGEKITKFADGTAKGVIVAASGFDKFSKAVAEAADKTGRELPYAVDQVRLSIAKTAKEMDDAQKNAKGFGGGVKDNLSDAEKAAQKAAKEMALLSEEIDNARTHGMSASEEVDVFGKKAQKAYEDARAAGVPVADNVRDIAHELNVLNAAGYYEKIAAQAQLGMRKIIEAEDKRQQKGLSALLTLATANAKYEQDLEDLYRTGTDAEIAQIERGLDAALAALPVETAENAKQIEIRKQQLREAAQWRIDAANGMYHTLGQLEKASGELTVADLQEQADKARLLYEQMRDSGAFSAEAVQTAWENSVKAQAKAVGGLKGDVLTMYAGLSTTLSNTLADMATHWTNWKDDLKKLWSDIAGDFTAMLAKMLKQWIEGFLMKMLASLTGAQGEFGSAWSGLMPQAGGGGGGWGSVVGGLVRGGGAAAGIGATGAVVGGTGVEAGIPIWSAASGAGTPVSPAAGGFGGGSGALGAIAQYAGGGLMAAGGIYSLIKAQTRTQNVIGGAETGAGIGTMIMPGIGTLIGAGVGAIGGLIKSFFGVSQQEKQGRTSAAGFQDLASGGLSAGQQKEAAGAVASGAWSDPKAAGTLIAVRDAYLSIGKTAADAEHDVKAMWDAETQGPDAVAKAIQPMSDALDAYQKKQQETADTTATTTDDQVKHYAAMEAEVSAGLADVNAHISEVLNSDLPAAQKDALLQQLQVQKQEYQKYLQQLETDSAKAGTASGTQFSTGFGTVISNTDFPKLEVPFAYKATNSLDDLGAGAGPIPQSAPTNINITAMDGQSVARVVNSTDFQNALAQRLPVMLTDNLQSSRTATRQALGV